MQCIEAVIEGLIKYRQISYHHTLLLFRYNLKDNVRVSLYDACNHWMKSIKLQGTKFMGGDTPDLSDLATYGVLSSIEGCNTFQDLLQHTAIGPWYDSMKDTIQRHGGCSVMNN